MKNCRECLSEFSDLREYVLDRIVVMGLDAAHFLKLEREVEKLLAKMQERMGDKAKDG